MSESLTLPLADGRELEINYQEPRLIRIQHNCKYMRHNFLAENETDARKLMEVLSLFAKKTPEQLAEEESKRLPVGCRVQSRPNLNNGVIKSNAYVSGRETVKVVVQFDHLTSTCEVLPECLTRIEDDE